MGFLCYTSLGYMYLEPRLQNPSRVLKAASYENNENIQIFGISDLQFALI